MLEVVRVLVGEDVGDAEVAGGPAEARALTRQAADDAAVEGGGELLGDVDRVVAGAVERRVVACGPARRATTRPGGTQTYETRGSGRSLARRVLVQ